MYLGDYINRFLEAQQVQRLTAKANAAGDTRSLDVALHTGDGESVSALNPLPVTVTSTVTGDEILAHKQADAVAKNASDTHTYTVTSGKTLVLQKIAASASGKIKVVIKIGTIGAEVNKVVLFNSTANSNVEYAFSNPQQIPDTDDVLVVITNLDNQAQNVYSSIEGYEV